MRNLILVILALFALDSNAQVNALSAAQSSAVQNYITNGGFENARHGWITYKNTAQALPVTGSGGTATTTLTTSTSAPLAGKASGLITHPASSVQGEGISYSFALDKDARGQSLQITGSYEIVSGTYSGGAGLPTIVDSDVEVYIYDVDSGTVIQPAGYRLDGGTAGVTYQIQATFQPVNLTSVNYRLIFHEPTTTTNAFVLRLDSVKVSRMVRTYASVVADTKPFVASGTWTSVASGGNATYTGVYNRLGDRAGGKFTVGLSGAPNATALLVNFIPGLSIDSTKTPTLTRTTVGRCEATSGGTAYTFELDVQGSQLEVVYQNSTTGALTSVTATQPVTWASGNLINCSFWDIPVVGWGSSTITSDSTDSRVIAASLSTSNAQTVTSSNTLIKFSNSATDSAGGYSTTTGLYTVQVPGTYMIYTAAGIASTGYASSNYASVIIAQNAGSIVTGTVQTPAALNGTLYPSASTMIVAKAGDTISVYAACTSSSACNYNFGNLTIGRISGASQIASTETVAARYTSSSGQTIGTSSTTVLFGTKVFDSHGAYSPTTGNFTCPVQGTYKVTATLTMAGVTLSTSQQFEIFIYKAGTIYSNLGSVYGNGAGSIAYRVNGSDLFKCNAGDTIYLSADSNVSSGLLTNSVYNFIDFLRVGN